MEVSIEKIGAEYSLALLGGTLNRGRSPQHVAKIGRAMENGDWRPNSVIQIAVVDGAEVLIDGQHRLAAIVQTGIPQEFLVLRGLSLDDQTVIDTGRSRTLADVLTINGVPNATTVASAVAWWWRREHGTFTSKMTPTIAEGLRIIAEHPGLRELASMGRAARGLRIPAGLACCLRYEMILLDAASADDFWSLLATSLGMHDRHPVYALRQRLEKNLTAVAKLDDTMICALIIKAWNAYMRGAEVTFLRWTRGGASPEPFPILRGLED